MLLEEANVGEARPDQHPPGWGLSIVAEPSQTTIPAEEILNRTREVWSVVASWGRDEDIELGDWPTDEECLIQLPHWFRLVLESDPEVSVAGWTDTLDEREWIWWSGAVVDNRVKVDIDCGSMPVSYWQLQWVIQKAGGTVLYRGQWINTTDMYWILQQEAER